MRWQVALPRLLVSITVGLSTTRAPPAEAASSIVLCAGGSGAAVETCLDAYVGAIRDCRDAANGNCEATLREPGGALAAVLGATEAPVRASCTAGSADSLTFGLGLDDLVAQTAQACRQSSEDLVGLAYAEDPAALSPEALECQRMVAAELVAVHREFTSLFGSCYLAEADQEICDRLQRDATALASSHATAGRIVAACGATFDALGVVAVETGPTLEDRVRALVDVVAERGVHLALRVFPPLRSGPTGLLGPHPVGVRTIELVDPLRPNPVGTGSRSLLTEIYYPSTPEATAGLPLDLLRFDGIDLFLTPTHRDAARASGAFPLVVYSHAAGGIRFENAIKLASLASHGFVVVSPERPGNDLERPFADSEAFENGPSDLRLVIDEVLARNEAAGDLLEGAIDPERIGGMGWSFGGYAIAALATGPFARGTFTDPRVKAILAFDGAMGGLHWAGSAPQVFETIHVPTLLLGGDVLFSATLAPDQQAMFDVLGPGPMPLGYGVLRDAGHYTFSDDCEVPEEVLLAIGGAGLPECGPEAIPWRYARYVLDYLALNFFAAALNGDASASARLEAASLAPIEELDYQAVPEPPSPLLAMAGASGLACLGWLRLRRGLSARARTRPAAAARSRRRTPS